MTLASPPLSYSEAGRRLTVLRADPAYYPAFSPEHAERLQAVMPSAQIHLVPGSPHSILAHRSTTAAYIDHFTAFLGL